jgi:hypothetical protein
MNARRILSARLRSITRLEGSTANGGGQRSPHDGERDAARTGPPPLSIFARSSAGEVMPAGRKHSVAPHRTHRTCDPSQLPAPVVLTSGVRGRDAILLAFLYR